jgi:hypothetical protein
MRKEYATQKREIRRERDTFAYQSDKEELFSNMEDPLLDKQKNSARQRIDRMNDKLIDANLEGYEAEMRGNNIQNELFRNKDQFETIGVHVRESLMVE